MCAAGPPGWWKLCMLISVAYAPWRTGGTGWARILSSTYKLHAVDEGHGTLLWAFAFERNNIAGRARRQPHDQTLVTGNSTDLENQLLPHIFLTMLNNHFGLFRVAS